ncbi:MAG TPA: MFS transporter [Polyangia bacterium]|jgi:MFS family permease
MSAAASSVSASSDDIEPYSRGAPAARLWTRPFVDLLISEALFGFSYALFVLLPKLLAVGYGATAAQIGAVMASFGIASLVTAPLIAPIVTRLDCRRTMILGCFLLGAAALGFTGIHGAGVLAAVLRGVQGIAWSLTFAAGMSLVAEVAPPIRLGHGIGLYGAVALATSALGPAVAEPIAARFGARPLFLLSGVVGLAAAWFCRRLSTGAAPSSPARGRAVERGAARSRAIVIGVLAIGSLASAAVSTFVAPFALTHGIGAVRGFFVTYTLTALGVRIGATRLVDRLGPRATAFAGAAGYGLTVIALATAGPEHLIPLGAAFGLVHGIVFPALMALILGEAAREERPRLLAFANGAINLGITGLGAIGAIADRVGYPPVFIVTGAVTSATAALLLLPSRRAPASASST